MRLSSMGQLALAVKESFATITVDRHTENNNTREVAPSSTQNRYVDSVEFSDRALELYMGAAAGMSSSEELDTDKGQEDPAANHQQQQPHRASQTYSVEHRLLRAFELCVAIIASGQGPVFSSAFCLET